jgi:hypothetical protein
LHDLGMIGRAGDGLLGALRRAAVHQQPCGEAWRAPCRKQRRLR